MHISYIYIHIHIRGWPCTHIEIYTWGILFTIYIYMGLRIQGIFATGGEQYYLGWKAKLPGFKSNG